MVRQELHEDGEGAVLILVGAIGDRCRCDRNQRPLDPQSTTGDDILELVSRRDVSGMSFTFSAVRPDGERWERRNGVPVRIITDALITEVSIVTFPSYAQTARAGR